MRAAPALTVVFAVLALAACSEGTQPPEAVQPATPPLPEPVAPAEPDDVPATGSLAAREAGAASEATLDFDCEGLGITVAYENDDTLAKFVIDGETLSLTREDAASGAMYTDADGNRFWAHRPDEARLTLDGDHERNCYRVY